MFSILMILFLGRATAHDYFISITTVEYNYETQSLEISLKITAHDLEKVLEDRGAPKLHLGSKMEHEKSDEYITAYLIRTFRVIADGKNLKWKYIGKEITLTDEAWIYIEVPTVDITQSINIKNSVLIETFPKQQNHVHLKLKDKNYSGVAIRDREIIELKPKE